MTEVLILEQYTQDIIRLNQKKAELIVQEIQFNSNHYSENHPNTFLGVNFSKKYRGIVIQLDLKGSTEHQFYINQFINQIFSSENNSTFSLFKDEKINLLTNIINKTTLDRKLKLLASNIKKQTNLSATIGIGDISSSIKSLNLSLIQAEKVVDLKIKNQSYPSFYDELDLGIILTAIEPSVQKYYVHKILKNIPVEEMEKYKEIFSVYEKHNKSVTAGAEELFIHKNTFQYQLNKITEYSGYNPTNLEDFVVLKLAFELVNF